jgi:hypothetical protein
LSSIIFPAYPCILDGRVPVPYLVTAFLLVIAHDVSSRGPFSELSARDPSSFLSTSHLIATVLALSNVISLASLTIAVIMCLHCHCPFNCHCLLPTVSFPVHCPSPGHCQFLFSLCSWFLYLVTASALSSPCPVVPLHTIPSLLHFHSHYLF